MMENSNQQILTKIEEKWKKERKVEIAYAMLSANLSIRHQKRHLGFTTLLLLPSSSMGFLRVMESLTYEFYPFTRLDTFHF